MTDNDKIAIKEMAQIICLDRDHRGDCDKCCYYDGRSRLRCSSVRDAEKLYQEDYRKQRKGKWIKQVTLHLILFKCSLCGESFVKKGNFCPNCGARMKGA